MVRYHVGVDVGKARHYVCVLDRSDGTCRRMFSVGNDLEGLRLLASSLETLSSDREDFIIGSSLAHMG